jgi:hypothetical protein
MSETEDTGKVNNQPLVLPEDTIDPPPSEDQQAADKAARAHLDDPTSNPDPKVPPETAEETPATKASGTTKKGDAT